MPAALLLTMTVKQLGKNLKSRISYYNKTKALTPFTYTKVTTIQQYNRLNSQFEKAKKANLGDINALFDVKKLPRKITLAQAQKTALNIEKAQRRSDEYYNAQKAALIKSRFYNEGKATREIKNALSKPNPKYSRDFTKYDTFSKLSKFNERLSNQEYKQNQGWHGDLLKSNFLKALRQDREYEKGGSATQPPNGFRFKGDASGVADFVEQYLEPEDIEFLIDDGFTFGFAYGAEDASLKEEELISKFKEDPRLGDIWEDQYEEKYLAYRAERLSENDI